MAAERYLSRRIPDLRVGNNIDEIDKKLIPASIHPCQYIFFNSVAACRSTYALKINGGYRSVQCTPADNARKRAPGSIL